MSEKVPGDLNLLSVVVTLLHRVNIHYNFMQSKIILQLGVTEIGYQLGMLLLKCWPSLK